MGPRIVRAALAFIDRVSEVSGQAFGWLIVPLVLGISWEVFARYVLNAPTVWAYDLAYMLYAGIFLLGTAYTLRHGAHIRTDFFYNALSERRRALVDVIGYLLFLPALALLLGATWDAFAHSWAIREMADSPWRPPLYPLKGAMFVGGALLFVQSVAELVRALYAAVGSRLS